MLGDGGWSFWLSGLMLALVPVLHWVGLRRSVAVSGMYTGLINRLRFGPPEESGLDEASMLAAIQAETASAFGEEALPEGADAPAGDDVPDASATASEAPAPPPQRTTADFVLFLVGLALGGFVAAILGGTFALQAGLVGDGFAGLTESLGSGGTAALLFAGGVFVGFGTRMAGGCTSGHGLCGVSQLQSGSFVATAAFFGGGVVTAFVLQWGLM